MNDLIDIKKDIKLFYLIFNNGESIAVSNNYLKEFDLELKNIVPVKDDPIFKNAFLFCEGTIIIERSYLEQKLGNDVIDKLLYRNGINSVVIHYNNDYKVKSDIPLMLCSYITDSDANHKTKLKYEENDTELIIRWDVISSI